jgi:hypothetical protein
MLLFLGQLMRYGGQLASGLLFDAHGSHIQYIEIETPPAGRPSKVTNIFQKVH